MKLDSNNHSVFLMYYHLALVVKYRRKVIDETISDYAKDKFVPLGEKYNIALVEWNHDIDHVHILFKAQPNSELSKFINAYTKTSKTLVLTSCIN
ncbi:transposase [[Bacillus] selenitireducens MLS10]|uniref:Transposase n=1 Tax=Bacillus selenitireducens (strain ATCC 700615 / DSM 15326 / MLS10) TaxID=439292 RepID=D6Y051_BACIE|nr:transposase [[Bacillus] selenitireducens MLS10]